MMCVHVCIYIRIMCVYLSWIERIDTSFGAPFDDRDVIRTTLPHPKP